MTLARKTPMRRTAFKRKEPKPFALPDRQQFERNQEAKKRLKSRPKRPTVAEGSKYLEACRGEPCFLNVDGFCGDWSDETVVPCHSNQSIHGKGMSLKAQHMFTVPGCAKCHEWLDRSGASRFLKTMVWDAAFARWEPVRARKMGIEVQQLEPA